MNQRIAGTENIRSGVHPAADSAEAARPVLNGHLRRYGSVPCNLQSTAPATLPSASNPGSMIQLRSQSGVWPREYRRARPACNAMGCISGTIPNWTSYRGAMMREQAGVDLSRWANCRFGGDCVRGDVDADLRSSRVFAAHGDIC